ncbi:PREDICTED: uncharacterized protein LOC104746965 [Camelina sativa]|uniref:Uncharacterized protein LOC104746965 n=1 Tax=Camelina sativa TaxID=90675 RepID=A0ABM0W7K0_CAMSA|nr:PREDICTED: uncharacterized protein LOC104746965 [Camelina sativa]
MITATAMGDFFGFKGSIAETALNPDRSDHLSDLVAVSNVEDLKTATSECAQEIHRMAQDPNGSSFLKSLFAKLSELRLIYEIVSLFDAFTGDPEQVKPTVCYTETGCQTFFSLLGYCDHIVKGRFVSIVDMFFTGIMTSQESLTPSFFTSFFSTHR